MIYNKVNERLTQTIYFSSTEWRTEKLSLEVKYFVIIMANIIDVYTVVSCSRATGEQPVAHEGSHSLHDIKSSLLFEVCLKCWASLKLCSS